MTKPTSSLAVAPAPWVAEYIAHFRRTTGRAMTVSAAGLGGWHTVTTTHLGAEVPEHSTRMRKADILAATERLRQRPDHAPSPDCTRP